MKLSEHTLRRLRVVGLLLFCAIILGGLVTAWIQREPQIQPQSLTQADRAVNVLIEKTHKPRRGLEVCPEEGSRLRKLAGCITIKRAPREGESK